MTKKLEFRIQSQPDDTTCGPACLASVFRYYDDDVTLEKVISETPALDEGGTLAVLMGNYALTRGYSAKLFTYNLRVFDPTWFAPLTGNPNDTHGAEGSVTRDGFPPSSQVPCVDLVSKLTQRRKIKKSIKQQNACSAYIEFIQRGGTVAMHELNGELLRYFLDQGIPILTGLSATWLYHCARQIGATNKPDDVRGEPEGHFVVIRGYDRENKMVHVADPWLPNPHGKANGDATEYDVRMDRLVNSIMLGILTYDANLMIIEPRKKTL